MVKAAYDRSYVANLSQPFASKPFVIETTIDGLEFYFWLTENWTCSLKCIILYLLLLVYLKNLMKNKEAFVLRGLMLCWNLNLALFSTLGAIRLVPELARILLTDGGFHTLNCDVRVNVTPVYYFWASLFGWSKVTEFGDTILIVLRKRPLTFLHVYHHCTVLFLCFYLGANAAPMARWFATMNVVVHSVMYTYYALKLLSPGVVPRAVAMTLTILQISQMVAGIGLNWYGYRLKSRGEVCDLNWESIYAAGAVYFSYLLLFARFFYIAYIQTGGKAKTKRL